MAKTIMVSNVAYEELKKLKDEDKSFSDVIIGLVSRKEQKTGYDLKKHFGILKGDKEYGLIQKELKAGWRKWTKKYA
jgi:predicted CopG family antitoxin